MMLLAVARGFARIRIYWTELGDVMDIQKYSSVRVLLDIPVCSTSCLIYDIWMFVLTPARYVLRTWILGGR